MGVVAEGVALGDAAGVEPVHQQGGGGQRGRRVVEILAEQLYWAQLTGGGPERHEGAAGSADRVVDADRGGAAGQSGGVGRDDQHGE